jgi:hypothetical protein
MEEEVMKRSIIGLIGGIVCALARPIITPAEEPAGELLKPCAVIAGADSHVAKGRYQRITSAGDWTRVWQEHKGEKPTGEYDMFYDPLTLPWIDFDHYMVIAIFQGNGSNNAGLRAISISEENDRLIFRFENKGYQTGGSGPGGDGNKTAAYGFFVVPRSTKPVVLEERLHLMNRKDKPSVWKERITFPKL